MNREILPWQQYLAADRTWRLKEPKRLRHRRQNGTSSARTAEVTPTTDSRTLGKRGFELCNRHGLMTRFRSAAGSVV